MIVFPNAKINIGLYVTEKRKDGYHNLETIFLPIPLYDALEIVPSDTATSYMKVFGGGLENEDPTTNLVWKAFELIGNDYRDKMHPIAIYLNKVIPMGAGMGGGSADATFMLQLLNSYFSLGISLDKLAEYALELGSDCPFFLHNKPMLAHGRGEELEPVEWPQEWDNYKLLLIHPPLHISTREAFSQLEPKAANFHLKDISNLPIADWKYKIHNDFEPGFLHIHPIMQMLKEELYAMGATYVSLTGTGSTFFALFPKDFNLPSNSILAAYNYTWCLSTAIR